MKAIVIFAASLMITTTLFAQPSRRSENTQTNNRRSESASSTDRRSSSGSETEVSSRKSSESGTSSRTPQTVNTERRSSTSEVSTPSSRRNSEGRPSERNQSSQNSSVQEPEKNRNTSVTNRREPQSPSSNRENNYTRNDNVRREPNKQQVIVVENHRPVERRHVVVHKSYRPVPVEVRRIRSPYRAPVRAEVIWTVDLSMRYEVYYPHYHSHHYHVGSRIATISAYDAYDFAGEIARVYGRVNETYYSYETDELFLYIGDYYPYHDFTVIVPAREAREFSRRPERFFEGEYIEVTGLISRFQGKPEMVIRRAEQIAIY